MSKLNSDQVSEIVRVKGVSNLESEPAKADIPEPVLYCMSVKPIGEYALLGRSKLACASQHTASIDPDRKSKRGPVFRRYCFRSELCRSVQRNRSLRGESFG